MSLHRTALLNQKISELPFSVELKKILSNHNFETLQDILKLPVHKWHEELTGFNFHHQHEIVTYLIKNNLSKFLKEE